MTWSVARSHRAAIQVRSAPLGARADLTIRPRSQFGFLRARPPLTLLLYIAAQDGLVVERGAGFAVLCRPWIGMTVRTGSIGLRMLRWLDRHWAMALFGFPAAASLLIAAATAIDANARHIALGIACAVVVWVNIFLLGMICSSPGWMARIGAAPGSRRNADTLPMHHWSVALVHQPEATGIDELIDLLLTRRARLITADLQDLAGVQASVHPTVTAALYVLRDGVTTCEALTMMRNSPRSIAGYPAIDVIVLGPSSRPNLAEPRHSPGSGLFLLYLTGLVAVVLSGAWLAASTERRACGTSCLGRPATYPQALGWILHRLIFTDPASAVPQTAVVKVLGWLVSIASVMLITLAAVAIRQRVISERLNQARHENWRERATGSWRVLILVVTEVERDAVLASVRGRTGREPALDHSGPRAVYMLGMVADCQLMLAQAGEQGMNSVAAMLMTATDAIRHCEPDCIVLTGICFGLRPDHGQRIGDIVVARRIQDLNHVKETDDARTPVIRRGINVGCSPELLDRFQAGQHSWSGASVHFGSVLTSNRLANSRDYVLDLREEFPDAIAGEMEAIAVYEAATRPPKPEWIMVKAISDWGFGKTEDAQPAAARNSAEFVMHVIAMGAFR